MAKWIEYGKDWGEFVKDGLNKPGTQIDVKNDFNSGCFLIGDIETGSGNCSGCCVACEDYDTVIQYRVLITEDIQNG